MFVGPSLRCEVSLYETLYVWIAAEQNVKQSYSVCVREIEFLTGRELTNEARPILVNNLCVFRQLTSEF